jgi:cytoskeleton protein RodZ
MSNLTPMSTDEEGANRRRIHLREITGDGELPLETVGQDLRAARLRRGDDLATVSKALKIRKDHLEALEEDRLDNLPGKTYAIGFIRTYAQYLGLDAAAFVERFKQEISGRADEHAPPTSAPLLDEEQRRLPQGWRWMGLVVVVLLAYGAYHLFSADRENSQSVPPPPVLPQKQAMAPNPASAPAEQAMPNAPADANPSSGPGSVPAGAAPNSQQATATPSPAAPMAAVAPTGKVYGGQNRNARVVLRARGATHIVVKGRDGTTFINRNLAAGDTYQVPNFVGLTLSTNNGGAVEVDLDGLAMGNAGSEARPVDDIQLDPQAIVDHFNNRRPG